MAKKSKSKTGSAKKSSKKEVKKASKGVDKKSDGKKVDIKSTKTEKSPVPVPPVAETPAPVTQPVKEAVKEPVKKEVAPASEVVPTSPSPVVDEKVVTKKASKLPEIGKSVCSFATTGNMKKGWQVQEFAKKLGAEAKIITNPKSHHQVQVELSSGDEKLIVPEVGYLTITIS